MRPIYTASVNRSPMKCGIASDSCPYVPLYVANDPVFLAPSGSLYAMFCPRIAVCSLASVRTISCE